MTSRTLNLVVAVSKNFGIGINGQLPWRLKGDVAFFKKITSEVDEEGKKNVVVMGRKSWDSLPPKFRPLPNRINIVLSRTLTSADVPEGVHVVTSFSEVFSIVDSPEIAKSVGGLFVLGGGSIYTMAINSGFPVRVFLTRVHENFECDAFFPEAEEVVNKYKKIAHPDADGSLRTENGLSYQIELYEKV